MFNYTPAKLSFYAVLALHNQFKKLQYSHVSLVIVIIIFTKLYL